MTTNGASSITTYFRVCDGVRVRFADSKADADTTVLLLSPWAAIFSGAAILIIAFALNLLGDVLRDALDPRLRGAR